MKTSISITFTLKGVSHSDTIAVESPTTLRVYQALARKLRKVTRVVPVLVSWSIVAAEHPNI